MPIDEGSLQVSCARGNAYMCVACVRMRVCICVHACMHMCEHMYMHIYVLYSVEYYTGHEETRQQLQTSMSIAPILSKTGPTEGQRQTRVSR